MLSRKALLIGCVLLVNFPIEQCSTQIAGVETTNGFTVVATATGFEGTAPLMSRVFIFDTNYIPYIDSGIGMGTAVNNEGVFQFKTSPGNYHLFIVGPSGNAASITMMSSAPTSAENMSKTRELQPIGAISGTFAGSASDTFLIFLAGMCHYQLLSAAQTFSLTNVPAGIYFLKIARLSGALNAASLNIVHEQSVTVVPGNTTVLGEIRF